MLIQNGDVRITLCSSGLFGHQRSSHLPRYVSWWTSYCTHVCGVGMVTLSEGIVYFLPERDMADISRVLADVPDWKGLAGSLNIRSDDIEENCEQDVARASCYRRKLVRRYCDKQPSENPSKVADEIAAKLEQMDHTLQAGKLRELKFGKSVTKRSSRTGCGGMPLPHAQESRYVQTCS